MTETNKEKVAKGGSDGGLRSDRLRNTPILKLLITMSLPAIFSMFVQACYNFMDTVFVGAYYTGLDGGSGAAIQALSLAFPIQLIITAFGVGIGVGANAVVSRKLGEGNVEKANRAAKLAVFLGLVGAVLMVVVGLTASRAFISALASTEEASQSQTVIDYGAQYLTIVTTFSGFSMIEIICGRLFQATGNMRVPMISQMLGAVINIGLDPLFLFAFKMGVAGVAIATVISQFVAFCFSVIMFIVTKQDVSILPKGFKFDGSVLKEMAGAGLPAFITNAVGAVTYITLMITMKGYGMGEVPQEILGLYFRLNSLIFMPTFGLMQGSLPILGYNYGSGDKKRYMECIKYTIMFSAVFMVIGVTLFEAAPKAMLGMFSPPPEVLDEGALALRLIAISFIPAAFGITTINGFQSVRSGGFALMMSLFRQLGIVIPFAVIFGRFGSFMIWLAYPVAETLAVSIFCPILFVRIRKRFQEKLKEKEGT